MVGWEGRCLDFSFLERNLDVFLFLFLWRGQTECLCLPQKEAGPSDWWVPGKGKGVCRTQPASAPTHDTRYRKWAVSICYSVCEHKCICKEHQQVYVLVQILLYKFLFRLTSMDTQSHILAHTQICPYAHLNAHPGTGTHIQKDIHVLHRHMCKCTFLGIFRSTYIKRVLTYV